MSITLTSSDNIRRIALFDGEAPAFLNQEIEIPGSGNISFQGREFMDQPFADLENLLSKANFEEIVEKQGYVIPREGTMDTWVGKDGLQLYYFLRQVSADVVAVVIVAFGEFQPGRYLIHVEGIYEYSGLEMPETNDADA